MKNIEKSFDKLVRISKRSLNARNYLLLYGFMCMAVSVITHLQLQSRVGLGIGFTGLIAGYLGIAMIVLAQDDRSRKAKVAMLILIPLAIAFIAQLYR